MFIAKQLSKEKVRNLTGVGLSTNFFGLGTRGRSRLKGRRLEGRERRGGRRRRRRWWWWRRSGGRRVVGGCCGRCGCCSSGGGVERRRAHGRGGCGRGGQLRRRRRRRNETLALGQLDSGNESILDFHFLIVLISHLAAICFFHFVLLFWNHVLIWTSVRFRHLESSSLLETDRYLSIFV